MNKKIIIGIIAALVVIGGTVGTVLGVQAYNTNKEYEQLAQNVADCKRMVENINYVYFPEDDTAKASRQRDLDKIATFKDKIDSKNLTEDEKSEFAEYTKTLKQNFENDKNQTKLQLDAVQASKNAHTDEGYYSDEFNNEWNGYVNQFNDAYNKDEYFNAFQITLNMQNKLNEYVAMKDKEAADKAEAERQAQEAEAAKSSTVKQGTSSKKSGSSGSSSSSSSSSKKSSGGSSDSNSGGSDSGSNESASSNNNSGGESYEGYASLGHKHMNEMFNKLHEEYGFVPHPYVPDN